MPWVVVVFKQREGKGNKWWDRSIDAPRIPKEQPWRSLRIQVPDNAFYGGNNRGIMQDLPGTGLYSNLAMACF